MKFLWWLVILLCACERELPIDVPQTVGRVVVEGNVSVNDHVAVVRLTRSVGLLDTQIPVIADASIAVVHVGSGRRYPLHYDTQGWYRSIDQLVGVAGDRFVLEGEVLGRAIRSECAAPAAVAIDSMRIERRTSIMGPVSDSAYTAYVSFTDPVGVDYYHARVWVNGKPRTQITVVADTFFEGKSYTLGCNVTLYPGDLVTVELQHISEVVYRYYFELKRAQSAMSEAPANPLSNVEGGVLGYFSAYGSSRISTTLSTEK